MKASSLAGKLQFGTASPFSWSHEYLLSVLTCGKNKIVKSTNLVEAFKMIDRADFVPQKSSKEAYNDTEIPIGYNEYLDKPTVIAEILQLLKPKEGGVYLDVGAGTGYVAALLGVAVSSKGFVYSIERKQFLADIAKININKYPFLNNVEIIFRDGLHGFEEKAPYDGIHVAAAYDTIPKQILMQLKLGGRLVSPTCDNNLHVYERISANEFQETIHKAYFFDTIQPGIE